MVDSMITLYESTVTEFTNNGLGSLPDAISCLVIEERNGEYELEMEYPITGKRYSELSLRRIILAKPNPYSNSQPFRIYSITKPINGIVTVSAEHISYDMSGYTVSPFSASTISLAFNQLKSNSVVSCPFSFWTDKTVSSTMTVEKPSSMRALLGGVQGSILDIYGKGEYEFDRYSVKLWTNRGSNRGVSIRYGKNLTDLEQEENCSAVYTGVYPFWYSEQDGLVQLKDKVVYAAGTYDFTRICPLDMSDKWSDKPTEEQLKTAAESYITSNSIGVPKVSLTVSFVQLAQSEEYTNYALLETVHLCDTVNVEFSELNVNATAKCIRTKYDVLTGKYVELTLGESKTNLASSISNQTQLINETPSKSFMEKAIDNATKLITGGLGGYVILHSSTGGKQPDEILIMDTDDILTATHVWRWNKNGLGYSKSGYNGPFATAITADGQIVATFITAGTFEGSLIKAGTVSAEAISVEYKTKVTEEVTNMGTSVTKELTTLIENSENAIRLLCKSIEEYSMHNYIQDGKFSSGDFEHWYNSNANNTVTTFLSITCAKILKTSSSSSYIRYDLNLLAAGTYRIRYKAATASGYEKNARIRCSFAGTSFLTAAGLLHSSEWRVIEEDITISNSSSKRYLYFYAVDQNAPIYITDVEVLGQLSIYTEAQLKVNSDAITAEVTRASSVEEELKSSIKVNANNITSCVTKGSIGSYITQYYNNVIVAFNNSSKYVQITAGAISIYNGTVNSNGLKSKFDSNGNHFWRDGYYVGGIGTNQWAGDASHKGLVFDLEYQGKYMAWAQQASSNASDYTTVLTYSRANSIFDEAGLHLGCDFYGHNFSMNNVSLKNSLANGYTVANNKSIPIITDIRSNGDGSISWTSSSISVRNGMITSVPNGSTSI